MRITTPPPFILPLYRTVSEPTTPAEQQRLVRRTEAANRYAAATANPCNRWVGTATVATVTATALLVYLLPRAPQP